MNTTEKIVEEIVLKQLECHFENIISPNESRFRRGDPKTLQLYRLAQKRSEAIGRDTEQLVGTTSSFRMHLIKSGLTDFLLN